MPKKSRKSTAPASPRPASPQESPGVPEAGDQAVPSGGVEFAKWTFLTNHAHVLIVLDANPSMVLREVAVRVGITERAVQRIIADLEENGFLERKRVGRQNHYRVIKDKPLRHPIEEHRSIGDLLTLITG